MKMGCPVTEIKQLALDIVESEARSRELKEHMAECPCCQSLFRQELDLNRQLKKLPQVVVPLDFSMSVMRDVRKAAGVPEYRKKSCLAWFCVAAAIFLLAFLSVFAPQVLQTPVWNQMIIGSFGMLVQALEAGIRAALAMAHASLQALQLIGGTLAYFARLSFGVPADWFAVLTALFLSSNAALFFLLRRPQETNPKPTR